MSETRDTSRDIPSGYTPPAVWVWNKGGGGRFAAINRPTAGPTHEHELPVGRHPLQLHSLGTPNGVKVTVLLEDDKGHEIVLAYLNSGEFFGVMSANLGDGALLRVVS